MTTTKTHSQADTLELVSQFCSLVEHTRALHLKPMAAITILEHDNQYCGALLTLYVADTNAIDGKRQQIPLTPYFYPAYVATHLETVGVLLPQNTTRRTGISVTWCDISDTLI